MKGGLLFAAIAAFMTLSVFVQAATPTAATQPGATGGDDPTLQGAALVQAAKLPCNVSAARRFGTASGTAQWYEVACTGALGYVIFESAANVPPKWEICLAVAKTKPDGSPNETACQIPQNVDALSVLASYVVKVGVPCVISKARGLGHTAQATYIELACSSGRGYVLKASSPPGPDQPVQLIPCLAMDPLSSAACKLTNSDFQLKVADNLAAGANLGCLVKDRRYLGASADLRSVYEVACSNGKGYMLEEDAAGRLMRTADCGDASVSGSCALSAAQANGEQSAHYSTLVRAVGYDCDVARYAPLKTQLSGRMLVELACANRPDGAIASFPAGAPGASVVYNCIYAEFKGYRCSLTDPVAAFPQLKADLNALGQQCAVSDARVIGTTPDFMGYVEVACGPNVPGFVLGVAIDGMEPKQALECAATGRVTGECRLPANLEAAALAWREATAPNAAPATVYFYRIPTADLSFVLNPAEFFVDGQKVTTRWVQGCTAVELPAGPHVVTEEWGSLSGPTKPVGVHALWKPGQTYYYRVDHDSQLTMGRFGRAIRTEWRLVIADPLTGAQDVASLHCTASTGSARKAAH